MKLCESDRDVLFLAVGLEVSHCLLFARTYFERPLLVVPNFRKQRHVGVDDCREDALVVGVPVHTDEHLLLNTFDDGYLVDSEILTQISSQGIRVVSINPKG